VTELMEACPLWSNIGSSSEAYTHRQGVVGDSCRCGLRVDQNFFVTIGCSSLWTGSIATDARRALFQKKDLSFRAQAF
jgi:hypothetical protein